VIFPIAFQAPGRLPLLPLQITWCRLPWPSIQAPVLGTVGAKGHIRLSLPACIWPFFFFLLCVCLQTEVSPKSITFAGRWKSMPFFFWEGDWRFFLVKEAKK
jgi:hypothetical protein